MTQHVLTWWQRLAEEPVDQPDLQRLLSLPGAKVTHVTTSTVHAPYGGTWAWTVMVVEAPTPEDQPRS